MLPQILKSILETKKVSKESESEDLKDKLLSVVRKFNKNQDFSFIFETNEQGVRTGNIIDAYTPEFRSAWYGFKNIIKNNLNVANIPTKSGIYEADIFTPIILKNILSAIL